MSLIKKKRSKFIRVTSGMSGFFAVMMWWNDEDPDVQFWEPYDTGMGRYETKEEAAAEAIEWAANEQIPYWADGAPMPKECE